MNSSGHRCALVPSHREQQTADHESKGDPVVPRAKIRHPVEQRGRIRAGGRQLKHHQPNQADQHQADEERDEPHARWPGLDLDRRTAHRADGEVALLADFGLRQRDLGDTVFRAGATIAAASVVRLRD